MTNFSPAAQAVLDATKFEIDAQENASLIAAADGCDPDWLAMTVLHHLHSIADELEQLND